MSKRLAQRHGSQQVHAAVDPRPAFAGKPQTPRRLGPDGNDHRRVLTPQFGQRHIPAHRHATADLDAQGLNHGHFAGDQVAGQPIRRHAQGQHAGRHGLRFEDHRPQSHQGQVMSRRQPRRSRSDDGHSLGVGRLESPRHRGPQQARHFLRVGRHLRNVRAHRLQHFVAGPHFRPGLVASEPLECPDGNRPVGRHESAVGVHPRHLAAAAGRFAGRPQTRPQIDASGFGPRAIR